MHNNRFLIKQNDLDEESFDTFFEFAASNQSSFFFIIFMSFNSHHHCGNIGVSLAVSAIFKELFYNFFLSDFILHKIIFSWIWCETKKLRSTWQPYCFIFSLNLMTHTAWNVKYMKLPERINLSHTKKFLFHYILYFAAQRGKKEKKKKFEQI